MKARFSCTLSLVGYTRGRDSAREGERERHQAKPRPSWRRAREHLRTRLPPREMACYPRCCGRGARARPIAVLGHLSYFGTELQVQWTEKCPFPPDNLPLCRSAPARCIGTRAPLEDSQSYECSAPENCCRTSGETDLPRGTRSTSLPIPGPIVRAYASTR